jgi:heme-degrading monooxygenase HmoA
MFVVRDVFQCKPGQARNLAERFKKLVPDMEQHDGFRNVRVMVDAVADYWTVVVEADFDHLADFEGHMTNFGHRELVRTTMAGYMDLVQGGRREVWRVV